MNLYIFTKYVWKSTVRLDTVKCYYIRSRQKHPVKTKLCENNVSFIPYFHLLVFGILVTLDFLSGFALQNVNKDYVIFPYFRNCVAISDQTQKTKNGMNKTKKIILWIQIRLQIGFDQIVSCIQSRVFWHAIYTLIFLSVINEAKSAPPPLLQSIL